MELARPWRFLKFFKLGRFTSRTAVGHSSSDPPIFSRRYRPSEQVRCPKQAEILASSGGMCRFGNGLLHSSDCAARLLATLFAGRGQQLMMTERGGGTSRVFPREDAGKAVVNRHAIGKRVPARCGRFFVLVSALLGVRFEKVIPKMPVAFVGRAGSRNFRAVIGVFFRAPTQKRGGSLQKPSGSSPWAFSYQTRNHQHWTVDLTGHFVAQFGEGRLNSLLLTASFDKSSLHLLRQQSR